MNSKEIAAELFGLVVRCVGLYYALYGVWYFYWAVLISAGLYRDNPLESLSKNDGPLYGVEGVSRVIAGLLLMRLAPKLVQFCYPTNDHISDTNDLDTVTS
jgi:hypothetical protein